MEKVKVIKNRERIFFSFLMVTLPFPFLVLSNYMTFSEYTFSCLVAIPIYLLTDNIGDSKTKRKEKDGVVFSNEGLTFYNLNKSQSILWGDLKVRKLLSVNRSFIIISFSSVKNPTFIQNSLIYWPNRDSYFDLINRYTPKNHSFYNLINS